MTPLRIAALLFFTTLQVACSRPSESSNAAPTNKSSENHAAVAEKVSEDDAAKLLLSELKAHKIADLDCLAFMSESNLPPKSKAALWEFAAREIHNEKCGGDPEVSPVRDRYKVSSASQVWVYDVVTDNYKLL